MKDETLVLTAEKTVVSVRMATLVNRFFAQLIDVAAWLGLNQIIGLFAMLLAPVLGAGYGPMMMFVQMFTLFALPAWQEATFGGRTVGKRLMKLRVISQDATPVTPAQAIYRNLVRFADILPGFYGVGVLSVLVTPNGQRLGDMAAGTLVIQEAEIPNSFIAAPYKYGVHHFETHIGELHNMTLEEYVALKRLTDRFPQLPKIEQDKCLDDIWTPFADRHKVPSYANVHPLLLMEAVVMKFGRIHHLV